MILLLIKSNTQMLCKVSKLVKICMPALIPHVLLVWQQAVLLRLHWRYDETKSPMRLHSFVLQATTQCEMVQRGFAFTTM